MPEPLDALDLAEGKRLAVVAHEDGLAALPMVRGPGGRWRRAQPGDGAAEGLLDVLARQSGTIVEGRFTVQSFSRRTALGERAIDADQTNESVIVGDTASAITQRCDALVDLAAEPEIGGVACRSYQHTWALLLALECHLAGETTAALADAVAAAADASAYLLDTESDWRLEVSEPLLGPSGVHLAAPAHRFCSAQQDALMLREGPRLTAVGCETGDWSHVDVYLTKTIDYRLLVFAARAWQAQRM